MSYLETPFKQTDNGWIFAPSVAILGSQLGTRFGKQYLVDDAQKARIQTVLRRGQRSISMVCLFYAILCGITALFMLGVLLGLWSFAVLPRPPFAGMSGGLIGLLFALPLVLALLVSVIAARRMAVGAPESSERITHDEVLGKTAADMSSSQIKMQIGISLLFVGLGISTIVDGIKAGSFGSVTLWLILIAFFAGFAMHSMMLMKRKRVTKTPSNC